MIKGVHSTFIWTEDLPGLLSFYRDTLGLETDMEAEGFVMFKAASGAQLGLGAHSEVKGKSKEPVRVMVNFTVDDCQAEYERLSGKGVMFVKEPEVQPGDGGNLATFVDPDGNTLQLFESPG
jgi:predicted enzyme related to lactoylglutathione lyase